MTTAELVALMRTRERIQGYRPAAALLELAEHEEVELRQASEVANLQAEADADLARRPHAGRALQRGWVHGPLPAPPVAGHRARGELALHSRRSVSHHPAYVGTASGRAGRQLRAAANHPSLTTITPHVPESAERRRRRG